MKIIAFTSAVVHGACVVTRYSWMTALPALNINYWSDQSQTHSGRMRRRAAAQGALTGHYLHG